MNKPVFHNIQNAVQAELFKATKSIKVAVAWFTNDLLYQVLLLKLQTGVSVELVLNDDEINRNSDHHLDFTKFVDAGGKLYWVKDKNLMHKKFCVIDENVVINGSYNWTYKAEYNDEDIMIVYDDNECVNEFIINFEDIIKHCPVEASNHKQDKAISLCVPGKETCIKQDIVLYMQNADELSYRNVYKMQYGSKQERENCTSPYKMLPYLELNYYDEISNPIRNGDPNQTYMTARKGNKWAFIDERGRTLLPITPFMFSYVSYKSSTGKFEVIVDNKFGIFDLDKKSFVLDPIFERYHEDDIHESQILRENNMEKVRLYGKFGLIDTRGNVYLACEYDTIKVIDKFHYEARKNNINYNITLKHNG